MLPAPCSKLHAPRSILIPSLLFTLYILIRYRAGETRACSSSYGEILQALSSMWCAWRTSGSIYRFALGLMLLRIAMV